MRSYAVLLGSCAVGAISKLETHVAWLEEVRVVHQCDLADITESRLKHKEGTRRGP